VIDGNNLYTGFTYDGLNRLLTTVYDYGTSLVKTITDAYNALNKTSRTDATSRVTDYSYDQLNRILGVTYVSDTNDNLTYSYDPVGNVLSVTPATGSTRNVAYTYDKLNRQLSELSGGATQTHQYDKAGNRTSTGYGGTGRGLTYTYDALNRQVTLVDATAALTTVYAYDLGGNIVQKTLANGTSEKRVHDGRNRTSTLNNVSSSGSALAEYAYQYDAAGNVMQVAETYGSGGLSNRTITNTYDGVYRLLTEAIATTGGGTVTTTYTYDKGQNRLSKTVAS
jgi:YD repeat-containing protein